MAAADRHRTRIKDIEQRIVVLVGLPGSGKTTHLAKLGVEGLSSDAVRIMLADDENDQSIHLEVFTTLRFLLRQRIRIGRPVSYVDATHLTPAERRPYIEMGKRHGCRVEALFVDVPTEVCQRRNRLRARVVPPEVIDAMAKRLVPPSVAEGFSVVNVVGR